MMHAFALFLVLSAPWSSLPAGVRGQLDGVMNSSRLSSGVTGALVLAAGTRPAASSTRGVFGLLPYDPAERPELYSHNAEHSFTPASNAKLMTTAAALDILGPDYQFTTRVMAPAAPQDGTVGELWLVGGGDPSLRIDDLDKLVAAVKAAGVRHVTGGIGADGSRFHDAKPRGWTDDDTLWYYGPEVHGIALERNEVDVTVSPGDAGGPARVTMDPENGYVRIEGVINTVAAGGGASLSWDHAPSRHALVIKGHVPEGSGGFTQGMAVPDVPLFCATVFRDRLKVAGVSVDGAPRAGVAPAGAVEVAKHDSKPLSVLVRRLLKESDNLYAEMLNREVGVHTGGDGGAAAGVKAVQEFLDRAGISTAGLHLTDGSGLSRQDLVTPRTLAGVLRAMACGPQRDTWWRALPIAGVDGTLSERMKNTPAAGNVRAKTGTISGRTALSGYVTTADGDLLIVSTIFNGFTCGTAAARALHDAVFVDLAGARR
jgi:D-alanyl-D-alanine carboxypeptidase/D-alanyl-D-alanine-endopeptidase (penicillin-binding protein 4)